MPVIVIGADTPTGQAVVERLAGRSGEVRAVVEDPQVAGRLKELGIKVATGDISDDSLVGLAAHEAYTAVLVFEAISDGRDLAFAPDPETMVRRWLAALRTAGVRRVIAVGGGPTLGNEEMEQAVVPAGLRPEEAAQRVVELDEAARLEEHLGGGAD